MRYLILFFTIISTSILSQQDPQFTQYFDNLIMVNPAYAGSTGMLSGTSMHREQWVGFTGRPSSSVMSIHSPLSYQSLGLGGTLIRDVFGPVTNFSLSTDIAYSLKLNEKSKLAFGIKAGLSMFSVVTSELTTTDPNDLRIMADIQNNLNPNIGFGIYYHTPNFFAGISAPRLIEQSFDITDKNLEKRHYYATIGGIFSLNEAWKLRPTTLIKSTMGAPLAMDFSLAAVFIDKLWIGSSYRLNAAVGAFAQFQISQQFRIGIASDFSTTIIRKGNVGTYEILLSYDFLIKKDGIRKVRYF